MPKRLRKKLATDSSFRRFRSNQRFSHSAQNSAETQRTEGNRTQAPIDDDVAWRFRIRLFQFGVQSEFTQQPERVCCWQQRTRSPFHKMAIDSFRTDDAANAISRFQDESFNPKLLQTIRTCEPGNACPYDNRIRLAHCKRLLDDIRQRTDKEWVAVKGRNSSEVGNPGILCDLLIEDVEFIQRLDVFGNETDRDDQDVADSALSILHKHVVGRGLQPFDRPDLALKGKLVGVFPAQPVHDSLHGGLRLVEVRIAFTHVAFRNTVSAEKQLYFVGFAELRKFSLDGRRKRFDIGRVFGPRRDPCGVQRLEAGLLLRSFRNASEPARVVVKEYCGNSGRMTRRSTLLCSTRSTASLRNGFHVHMPTKV